MDELQQVGPRLRSARQDRGWTLDDLASLAGMSPSTLSRLESGKRQASLELLLPLTRQLGMTIDTLLEPRDRDPRVRRNAVHQYGMTVAPLTREESEVRAFKITYHPEAPEISPRTHEGHEWFYVLSGTVRLTLDGEDHVFSPGEAGEFDTQRPHRIRAAGPAPAEVISLFNTLGERMHLHSLQSDFRAIPASDPHDFRRDIDEVIDPAL